MSAEDPLGIHTPQVITFYIWLGLWQIQQRASPIESIQAKLTEFVRKSIK